MFDPDDLINDAFDDFSRAAAPCVRPTGTSAVRTTAKHRRTMRAMTLSLLAVLVIVAPVTAYALTTHGGQSPPTILGSSPTAVATTVPSSEPSTIPAPSPSAPTGPPSTAPTASDGRIAVSQLVAAGKVTIPKWHATELGCPSGKQKLAKGTNTVNHGSGLNGLQIYKVAYVNLDSDSALETAALITCQFGEAAWDQVVAFDRDSSGHIVTLGTIVEGHLWNVTESSAGVVVDISDMQACCDTPKLMEEHQTRTYAWTGSKFAQTGGPTTFYSHPKPNVLTAVVKSADWGAEHTILVGDPKTAATVRTGTIKLTITNHGPYDSRPIFVSEIDGSGAMYEKTFAALASGKSETVTIVITIDSHVTAADHDRLTIYELGSETVWPANTPYGVDVIYPLWS